MWRTRRKFSSYYCSSEVRELDHETISLTSYRTSIEQGPFFPPLIEGALHDLHSYRIATRIYVEYDLHNIFLEKLKC